MTTAQNPGNQANEPKSGSKPKHSRFDLSRQHFTTHRFGELVPLVALETVPTDNISLRHDYDIRTLTMQNPLLSNLRLNKDFYNIPMEAILPLNWDKVYTNPIVGDDVSIDVNCVIPNFIQGYLNNFASGNISSLTSILQSVPSEPRDGQSAQEWSDEVSEMLSRAVMCINYLEMFFSPGSLLNVLGYKLYSLLRVDRTSDINQYKPIDIVVDDFYARLFKLTKYGRCFYFADDSTNNVQITSHKGYRQFIQHVRSEHTNLNLGLDEYLPAMTEDLNSLKAILTDHTIEFETPTLDTEKDNFNFGRVVAYQLVCSHFYNNDKIDYIYSAELFRQLIGSYYKSQGWSIPTFTYNGLTMLYDFLSGRVVGTFFVDYHIVSCYNALCTLFGFKNSLKYKDYFTGARSNPLAVGNTMIPVTGQDVDVLDVTRKIQVQRFLNSVNRAGRKFSNYISGLFGADVKYDYHNPAFLSHTEDYVLSHETQNTGSEQRDSNAITTTIKSSSGKFAFQFDSDRPSIIIGIGWYDMRRIYSRATDKTFFHADRFDMFNPYMQYIGDQAIERNELDLSRSQGSFGYQFRYQEYKESFDVASGAFSFPIDQNLANWAFIADDDAPVEHIKPSYIRSRADEFDKFFAALPNYALATYFHFIFVNDLDISANRPMSIAPEIL